MLTALTTTDFAIVKKLNLAWHAGFSAITGETGAGKSISIDALMFCLGARSDAKKVRPGAKSAIVKAIFDISRLPSAQQFLEEHGLNSDEGECELRRFVTHQGRSKSYINGHTVSTSQLRELGDLLVSIHGQHAHQKLVNSASQRGLIDSIGQNHHLLSEVKKHFEAHQALTDRRDELVKLATQSNAKRQLLTYQVDELDKFNAIEGEYEALDAEFTVLSHGSELQETTSQSSYALLDSDDSIVGALQSVTQRITALVEKDPRLSDIAERFTSSSIELEEAARDLNQYADSVDVDPARLAEAEQRISEYVELSRKHHCLPHALHLTHEELANELKLINDEEGELEAIEVDIAQAANLLNVACEKLSKSRIKAAESLSLSITNSMQTLNMHGGEFSALVTPKTDNVRQHGYDDVTFLVSTNPGQSMQPIGKVASGGELSRISLAAQVAAAEKSTIPSLIFDEVDVGISGGTAAIVGKLLRDIGRKTQVISITHLPQVACYAQNHYLVSKVHLLEGTHTRMALLSTKEQKTEIARLLGGEHITDESLKNANKLLEEGSSHAI